ncbi:MAG: hypothetical protein ABFS45_10855 [Pseudomonadota bacterium]
MMDITFADEQDRQLHTEPLIELARVALTAEGLPSSTQLSISLCEMERCFFSFLLGNTCISFLSPGF